MAWVATAIKAAAVIKGQMDANKANKSEGERNRGFQGDQTATSHQREVADLRAAGLNPILSAKYGGAGNAPGAQAVMKSTTENLPSTALMTAQIANLNAVTEKEKANTQGQINENVGTGIMADLYSEISQLKWLKDLAPGISSALSVKRKRQNKIYDTPRVPYKPKPRNQLRN